ncbi:hypothetical protein EJ05DRAFT_488167 [Pseudovirgaria hyperparasitica]|uniref:Uncharacterized protein n=1 Tax=Pseudovirgaria hyperparasitica TaxID=470096 RepID=A0A6A6VYN9_9PEZI|nr:uncharacterized protein EJ05DRAFT_488167 [Pseudovirgaria hyperparasitica]KAF2755393.1 hypothetical protein EJ05DRAFT_488167 [Pseudovirgaria hyperparasitica]
MSTMEEESLAVAQLRVFRESLIEKNEYYHALLSREMEYEVVVQDISKLGDQSRTYESRRQLTIYSHQTRNAFVDKRDTEKRIARLELAVAEEIADANRSWWKRNTNKGKITAAAMPATDQGAQLTNHDESSIVAAELAQEKSAFRSKAASPKTTADQESSLPTQTPHQHHSRQTPIYPPTKVTSAFELQGHSITTTWAHEDDSDWGRDIETSVYEAVVRNPVTAHSPPSTKLSPLIAPTIDLPRPNVPPLGNHFGSKTYADLPDVLLPPDITHTTAPSGETHNYFIKAPIALLVLWIMLKLMSILYNGLSDNYNEDISDEAPPPVPPRYIQPEFPEGPQYPLSWAAAYADRQMLMRMGDPEPGAPVSSRLLTGHIRGSQVHFNAQTLLNKYRQTHRRTATSDWKKYNWSHEREGYLAAQKAKKELAEQEKTAKSSPSREMPRPPVLEKTISGLPPGEEAVRPQSSIRGVAPLKPIQKTAPSIAPLQASSKTTLGSQAPEDVPYLQLPVAENPVLAKLWNKVPEDVRKYVRSDITTLRLRPRDTPSTDDLGNRRTCGAWALAGSLVAALDPHILDVPAMKERRKVYYKKLLPHMELTDDDKNDVIRICGATDWMSVDRGTREDLSSADDRRSREKPGPKGTKDYTITQLEKGLKKFCRAEGYPDFRFLYAQVLAEEASGLPVTSEQGALSTYRFSEPGVTEDPRAPVLWVRVVEMVKGDGRHYEAMVELLRGEKESGFGR